MTTIDAARSAYENLPEDENHPDRVQRDLASIDGEDHDAYAALAIIDHVGAAFEAQDDGEAATRALGSALCESAVMLLGYRLAISPVLELVRENCKPGSAAQPVEGPAKLARVVRKGAGPHLDELVSALALSLAQALDSVQIMHAVTVDLGQLFVHMARMGWKTLVVGPAGGPQRVYRLRPVTDARASEVIYPVRQAEQPSFEPAPVARRAPCPGDPDFVGLGESPMRVRIDGDGRVAEVDYGQALRDGADAIARTGSREEEGRMLAAQAAQAKAVLHAEFVAHAKSCAEQDAATASWKRRLCPVCAGPMSYLRDNLYGCGQHEHQEEHLRNLGLTQEDLDRMRAAPAPTAGGCTP